MRPTVLLFDVDGTLITTGGVGRRAIVRALAESGLAGSVDFSFAGMTDRAIVRRGLVAAGHDPVEADIDRVLERYVDVLREEVAAADSRTYRLHEGMLEALDTLEGRDGFAVGLGTGNVERGARIKLERVGIAHRFAFGGFGCDSEDRAELVRAGAERGAARLGHPRQACRVVVIGDTPKDVAAAMAMGAESLAVATGTVSRATLAQSRPSYLFDSLASPGALQALLAGAVG